MKIKITSEDKEFTFTDEQLNNHNFVEFYSENEMVAEFSLDELISVARAFEEKRKQELTRDNLLK